MKTDREDHWSNNSYLVSLDVPSLYTNIPPKERTEFVKNLKKLKPGIIIKVILTFLKFMAEKTFCYGSKCAPSYANNFTV